MINLTKHCLVKEVTNSGVYLQNFISLTSAKLKHNTTKLLSRIKITVCFI